MPFHYVFRHTTKDDQKYGIGVILDQYDVDAATALVQAGTAVTPGCPVRLNDWDLTVTEVPSMLSV